MFSIQIKSNINYLCEINPKTKQHDECFHIIIEADIKKRKTIKYIIEMLIMNEIANDKRMSLPYIIQFNNRIDEKKQY